MYVASGSNPNGRRWLTSALLQTGAAPAGGAIAAPA
jgi:hypothetical protein